jgi:hypothetical protein
MEQNLGQLNNVNDSVLSYQAAKHASPSFQVDSKAFMKELYNKLDRLGLAYADSSPTMDLTAYGFGVAEKNSAATSFAMTVITDRVQTAMTTFMGLITKEYSFDDQVAKLMSSAA